MGGKGLGSCISPPQPVLKSHNASGSSDGGDNSCYLHYYLSRVSLRDPFSPAMHEVVETAMREVDATLAKLGRPLLPDHLYSYHHHHHHHSHHHHHHLNTTGQVTKHKNTQDSNSIDVAQEGRRVEGTAAGATVSRDSEGDGASHPKVLQLNPWVKGRWVCVWRGINKDPADTTHASQR